MSCGRVHMHGRASDGSGARSSTMSSVNRIILIYIKSGTLNRNRRVYKVQIT